MTCPKCKSDQVSEGTAGTQHCDVCDYSWLPYNTAPRFADSGVTKKESPAGLAVLILIVVLIAIALGFVSPLWAVLVGIVGLLAVIAMKK